MSFIFMTKLKKSNRRSKSQTLDTISSLETKCFYVPACLLGFLSSKHSYCNDPTVCQPFLFYQRFHSLSSSDRTHQNPTKWTGFDLFVNCFVQSNQALFSFPFVFTFPCPSSFHTDLNCAVHMSGRQNFS